MSAPRRYRFVGRSRDGLAYYWEGPATSDGCVELVTCSVAWFWRAEA